MLLANNSAIIYRAPRIDAQAPRRPYADPLTDAPSCVGQARGTTAARPRSKAPVHEVGHGGQAW